MPFPARSDPACAGRRGTLPRLAVGLDFGTSGARLCVIDRREQCLFETACAWPDAHAQRCADWEAALLHLLASIPTALRRGLDALSLCATSGSVLWADRGLRPLGPALMYFDRRAESIAAAWRTLDPAANLDALARLEWLWRELAPRQRVGARPMHQADWLLARLLRQPSAEITDWHNALKSGADPAHRAWSSAARQRAFAPRLPRVVSPGARLGRIDPGLARTLGLPPALRVHAGTTDANAAFLAAGASLPGQALSTLGSTLVIKLLSPRRIDDAARGVYSHRFGSLWLVSRASRSGAAVLRAAFGDVRVRELSRRVDPERDSELDPFGLADTAQPFALAPPSPPARTGHADGDAADVSYLHGLLQGLARIEASGYRDLAALGAPPARLVLGSGGGAANPAWTRLRERALGVPVRAARHTQAAFGAARLALYGGAVFDRPTPAGETCSEAAHGPIALAHAGSSEENTPTACSTRRSTRHCAP